MRHASHAALVNFEVPVGSASLPKLLKVLTVGVLGLLAVFVAAGPTRANFVDPTVFSPPALDFGPVALNQSVTLPLNVSLNVSIADETSVIVSSTLGETITGANFTFTADPSNVEPCFDVGCNFNITFTQRGTNMQGGFDVDYIFFDTNQMTMSEEIIDGINLTASLAQGTSATPLPAALPLFATGLGAMGLFGWRRKRKAQAVAA